jgi:ABC-type transport system involved in multi-copper enzyme maturation permease subunit
MNFFPRIWILMFKLLSGFGLIPWLSRKVFGPRITAMAMVTMQATVRFRLFPALLVMLMLSVIVLPLVIKDDGTARGLTQILLTYTLGLTVAIMGFSTLWLACGVLARDIEDCTIQTLAVKPIARWEIWIGKWLGIMALNAILLLYTGCFIYGSVQYRASKLPKEQKEILAQSILVGRGSIKRPVPDIKPEVEAMLAERMKDPSIAGMGQAFVRKQVEEIVKRQTEYVPPLRGVRWEFDFGALKGMMKDRDMQLRVMFHKGVLTQIGTFPIMLQVGPPESPKLERIEQVLTDENYAEIPIVHNLLDDKGILNVEFYNMSPVPLLLPMDEGIEVLYYETGFGVNFARGIFIVYLWLGLLAALGLAAASYMSFPVAAFFSLAMLVLSLSSGIMETVVKDGTITGVNHETGQSVGSLLDLIIIPMFQIMLKIVNMITEFSPVDNLSSGRSVSWGQCLRAIGQIGFLVTGLLGLVGIGLFYRRELASVQQTN